MLDTVRLEWTRFFHPEIADALEGVWTNSILPGWDAPMFSGSLKEKDFGDREEDKRNPIFLGHKDSGLRVWGNRTEIRVVEVSLPRLLHGYNGRLLKSPEELDEAWTHLEALINEISRGDEPRGDIRRLDLAWNVRCDPQRTLLHLKNAKWPRVHSEPECYLNSNDCRLEKRNTLRFQGKEWTLQFYDKVAELKGKRGVRSSLPSRCLRIELQLKSKNAIRRIFGKDDLRRVGLRGQDFLNLYRIFRHEVAKLKPAKSRRPKGKITMDALFAMTEEYHELVRRHGLEDEIPWKESPLDLYAAEVAPETAIKRRKAVAGQQLREEIFQWETLLPKGAPPAGIDVYPDGAQEPVSTLWFLADDSDC